MRNTMPPLTSLRAFKAAARHLSLTKAAQELNVTAGAPSHQIRGLEEFIDVDLFERRVSPFSGTLMRNGFGVAASPAVWCGCASSMAVSASRSPIDGGDPPPSAFKNQARARAMSEQAPFAICEASFGRANPSTAIQHNALRLDPSSFWPNGSHERNFELDGRLREALIESRLHS